MPNATYLTEKYPGREADLWTPCIFEFFNKCKPKLSISTCISNPTHKGPWYEFRKKDFHIENDDILLTETGYDDLLIKIEKISGLKLRSDPGRFRSKNDISGIIPDIVLIQPKKQNIYIIENKPYYHSKFDGNQGPDGDYINFVFWLNKLGLRCYYIIILSCSWREYQQVKKVQDKLDTNFGLLMLEDIFAEMARYDFKHVQISENWIDFTDKSVDCA